MFCVCVRVEHFAVERAASVSLGQIETEIPNPRLLIGRADLGGVTRVTLNHRKRMWLM